MYLIKKIFIIPTCEKLDEARRENWMISQSWASMRNSLYTFKKYFINDILFQFIIS